MVGDQWRLDYQVPTILDSCGNTNNVMELTKTTIETETETEKKSNIKTEKPSPPSTLPAQALTMLITRLSSTEWLRKKFVKTFSLFVIIWMIVDMVLDWLFCYKFYQMCLVRS